MTAVLSFSLVVLSLSFQCVHSGYRYVTCKEGEIIVSYCKALQRDRFCEFCQPDSNLGLDCSVDSDCHDANSKCDGIRCGCSDCNVCTCYLPYVDSNGRYFGGECSTGEGVCSSPVTCCFNELTRSSNLGSRCVNDAECYDGRQCNGTTCGCIKTGRGKPTCGCKGVLGYRDSNGGGAIGGTCVLSNLHEAACTNTNDCFDEAGSCDGGRCGCTCNVCHNIEPAK